MPITKRLATVLCGIFLTGACLAGDWLPRKQAIWNIASGYAFMTQCAGRGHAPMEAITRLGALYQSALAEPAYVEWRDVFQRTLHEKRMYSIAKDAWLPYTVSVESCKDVGRVAEMYVRRLTSGKTDQLPN